MRLIFVAYEKDTTTLLGELTHATEKRVRPHYNGWGEGYFEMNRYDAQAAWCAADNYIRVYLDSTSNDPIFGFFIGQGEDTPVSSDEEGGEILQRGGPGALSVLSEAIIDPTGANARYSDGVWRWTDGTMGQIVSELIDDAQARGCLPMVTYDFDATDDSDGNPWDTFDGSYDLAVGIQLDEAVGRLQSAGLIAQMSPDFVLSARTTVGVDRSATITFARGDNITEDAQREVTASAAKSAMLVQGQTSGGTLTFAWATDSGVETALGRRKEGFVRYQSSASSTVLDRVGTQAINRLKKRHDGLSQIGVLETDHIPFTDYFPGDTVNINVPGEFANLHAPITAIAIFDVENGDAGAAAEFEDIAFEALQLNDRTDPTQAPISGGLGSGGGSGGGSSSGCADCPPVGPGSGSVVATEHWDDREYSNMIESDDTPVLSTGISTSVVVVPDTRFFVRHEAPMGAVQALLVADVYARRTTAGSPLSIQPTIWVGAGGTWHDASLPVVHAQFADIGALLWHRTFSAEYYGDLIPRKVGSVRAVVPVVSGELKFVVGDESGISSGIIFYLIEQSATYSTASDMYDLEFQGATLISPDAYVGGQVV